MTLASEDADVGLVGVVGFADVVDIGFREGCGKSKWKWGIQVILVTGQNLYGKCQNQ